MAPAQAAEKKMKAAMALTSTKPLDLGALFHVSVRKEYIKLCGEGRTADAARRFTDAILVKAIEEKVAISGYKFENEWPGALRDLYRLCTNMRPTKEDAATWTSLVRAARAMRTADMVGPGLPAASVAQFPIEWFWLYRAMLESGPPPAATPGS